MAFSILRAAALALALVSSPLAAAAQDAGSESDPVVASVNGRDVHRSKVMAAAQSLPPQLQAQIDQIFPMLVERVVDFELIDMAAVEAGFADDQEVLDRLAEVGDAIIREVYLTRQVSAGDH